MFFMSKTMGKKFFLISFLFYFCQFFCIDSKTYFVLQLIPKKSFKSNAPSQKMSVYYKGAIYDGSFDPVMGTQIFLSDKGVLPDTFCVVVAPSIEPIYNPVEGEQMVSGLRVSSGVKSHGYRLTLCLVHEDNGFVHYYWDIDDVDVQSMKILPKDAIVVTADPAAVLPKRFDEDFKPQYPSSGILDEEDVAENSSELSANNGILFLPPLYIDYPTLISSKEKVDGIDVKSFHEKGEGATGE